MDARSTVSQNQAGERKPADGRQAEEYKQCTAAWAGPGKRHCVHGSLPGGSCSQGPVRAYAECQSGEHLPACPCLQFTSVVTDIDSTCSLPVPITKQQKQLEAGKSLQGAPPGSLLAVFPITLTSIEVVNWPPGSLFCKCPVGHIPRALLLNPSRVNFREI